MDIMHAIADIEQRAQEIISSANELEQNRNEILAEEIRKREEQMKSKLSEQCEKIKRQNELECKERLAVLEGRYSEMLEKLEAKCNAGKSEWAEKIFVAVVNG